MGIRVLINTLSLRDTNGTKYFEIQTEYIKLIY